MKISRPASELLASIIILVGKLWDSQQWCPFRYGKWRAGDINSNLLPCRSLQQGNTRQQGLLNTVKIRGKGFSDVFQNQLWTMTFQCYLKYLKTFSITVKNQNTVEFIPKKCLMLRIKTQVNTWSSAMHLLLNIWPYLDKQKNRLCYILTSIYGTTFQDS